MVGHVDWFRFLLVIFMLHACTPPLSQASNAEDIARLPVAMEVFLKKPTDQTYTLHIHLTNISKQSVNVDLHDLPWNPPNDAKWLSAIRMNDSREILKQQVHRWEIGSQDVPLQPGESIQGKILLNPRFPTLLDDIRHYGVQLRWECPPATLKFVCQDDSSNAVIIPKGDRGHADTYSVDATGCRQAEDAIHLIKIPQDDDVLFLYMRESMMEDLAQVRALLQRVATYIRQCRPRWTNSWSVSFFTNDKVAGFLRDGENEHFFKEGLWQESNIGQYSSQVRKLFRFPWQKKKADEVYLSVYQ